MKKKKEKEKEEGLNGTAFKMNERFEELERKDDRQEQWRSCILIYGVTENKEGNTDQQAIDFKICCLKTGCYD